MWPIWLVVGVVLGWSADALFGPGADPAAAPPRARRTVSPARMLAYLAFGASLVFGLIALLTSLFEGCAALLLALEAFVQNSRLVSLLIGVLLGVWLSRNRARVSARLSEFYAALLGTETHSSWALQSAVAIFALFLVILALKPDLLDKLESVKAGEVEAKFSSVTATTRDAARIGLSDIRREATIEQWIGFSESFLGNSPRGKAVDYFDESSAKAQRKEINTILFDRYIEPLALLLACLKKDDRLDDLRIKVDLARAAVTVRNRFYYAADAPLGLDVAGWKIILDTLSTQIKQLGDLLAEQVPVSAQQSCKRYKLEDASKLSISSILGGAKTRNPNEDAGKLAGLVSVIVQGLPAAEAGHKLAYIDPYVVGAVGDFIALTLGLSEKTNFLSRMKRLYPTEPKFTHPGLINLYFQLADTKIQSFSTWPLQEMLLELDHATKGADYLISSSKAALEAAGAGATKDASAYQQIIATYLRNKLIFTIAYVDIYTYRSLSGEAVTESDRRRWAGFHRQAEAVLNLKDIPVVLALAEPSEPVFSSTEAAEWKDAATSLETAAPDRYFDARITMALSAIMLTERRRRAPGQACAVARYHLLRAKGLVPSLQETLKLREPESERLRGYVLQVEARIDAVCG